MPVPRKIQDVELLRSCYIDKKMSTTEISFQSETIFGIKVSLASVYNSLVKHGIPLRSKSESVSRARSILNIDVSYFNYTVAEWVDGFLLGDGCISHSKNGSFFNARFSIDSSEKEWTLYAMSGFSPYRPSEPQISDRKDDRHPNPAYYSRTLTHPDIIAQARRWYPNRKKVVPVDVRVTPVSTMLWYLGDGSFTYQPKTNAGMLRLHTCGFSKADVEGILIPKLEAVGLSCWRDPHKGDIHISSNCVRLFFDFVGHESPIPCYAQKFAVPEWLGLKRLSDITRDDQERWKATKWVQEGKVVCTRSPAGRLFLFSDQEAAALRQRLDGA